MGARTRRTWVPLVVAPLLIALWHVWGPLPLAGGTAYVTTHGISMKPRFTTGDLALVRPTDHYAVGDVAAYRSARLHTVVLHRIIAQEGRGYRFKGDNNDFVDQELVPRSALVGTLRHRIAHGGVWLARMTDARLLGVLAFLLVGGGGTAVGRRRRRRRGTGMGEAGSGRPALAALACASSTTRALAATSAALLALGLVLGVVVWTGPVTELASSRHASSHAMVFSYAAKVPKTPVYDGTVVRSPEPVYRALADRVAVHYTYTGPPGTVAIDVRVQTDSGWHTRIALEPPHRFTTDHYTGTAHLDLAQMGARATAAARITGMDVGSLRLSVVPHVRMEDGTLFEPALGLVLTPRQLSLADPGTSLSVEDATSVQEATTAPRSLGVGPLRVRVGTARGVSVLLLLLGGVVAAAALATLRREPPLSPVQALLRRNASVLVAVAPLPTPGGRLVDVADFSTLVRLAARYELLVLHWPTVDGHVFVLPDGETTYRYRAESAQDAPAAPQRGLQPEQEDLTDAARALVPTAGGDPALPPLPTQRSGD